MKTWHIHIKGLVQGVGFRPFIFLLAKEYGLKGWVNNTVEGVHIEINANEKLALEFCNSITAKAPTLARITAILPLPVEQKFFDDFQIIQSEKTGSANLLLTRGLATNRVKSAKILTFG